MTEQLSQRSFPPIGMETARYLENFKRDYLTIECGDWTYGNPRLEIAKTDQPRRIQIGRYCSIGPNVTIYVGRQGRHPTDTISTYPMSLAVSEIALRTAPAKTSAFEMTSERGANQLDVVIGSDVWIGQNAVIVAGIRVGNGAVIGTNALVTKDVPAYAIVGGVPASVMRYRHPPEIVAALICTEWWKLEPDELWAKLGPNYWSRNIDDVLALLAVGTTQPEEAIAFWPSADIQKKYTGSSGAELYARTRRFVDYLATEGVLPAKNLSVLDYACGWGRIASVIYSTHGTQCVLADAWPDSLKLLKATGLPGEVMSIPEALSPGSLGDRKYSLIYSFSLFTHLNPDSFRNNLKIALSHLESGGRMYFTVRHDDFLAVFNAKSNEAPILAVEDNEICHYTYAGQNYGETIVGRSVLSNEFGNARYCLEIDPYQHLYCIERT